MSPKSTVAVALLLAGATGFFVGGSTKGLGLFAPTDDTEWHVLKSATNAPAASPDAAPGSATLKTAEARAAADAETARVRSENVELSRQLAESQKALADAQKRAAGSGPNASTAPTFTFGEMGTLPAVLEADWPEMSASSKVITDALLEIQRKNAAGEAVPKEVYFRLQENTERMRKFEYRTIDKIPTAAKHNGELTHPVTVANLIAGLLAQQGKPLSAAQSAEVERLGLAFDKEFVALRAGWVDGVPRAKRMLEEYRLKGRFTDGLWAALTAEQRAVWIDPALHGVAGIDLYDPTLMIIHTSPVVVGDTPAEIRTKLLGLVRTQAGIKADAPSPAVDRLVDAFLVRVTPSLEPVPKSRLKNYSFAQGLAAGEATVELVEGLLREPDLAPAARQALLDDFTWYVPRLRAA